MSNERYKFRAWFTAGDAEVLNGQVCSEQGERTLLEFLQDIEDCCRDHGYSYILMQYTGLHDRNGVEIYEGDIIQTQHGTFPVGWSKSRAKFIAQYGQVYVDSENWARHEVVGNRYQNPELLK